MTTNNPMNSESDMDPTGNAHEKLLAELILLQDQSWQTGSPVPAEILVDQFSEKSQLPASAEVVLEFVCNEIYLRKLVGQSPTLEEYTVRFPRFADALSIQWQVDELLSENSALLLNEHTSSPTAEFTSICEQFENAWRHSKAPNIIDCLSSVAKQHRQQLLKQLLIIDIRYRSRKVPNGGVDPSIYTVLGDEAVEIAKQIVERTQVIGPKLSTDWVSLPSVATDSSADLVTKPLQNIAGRSEWIGPYKLLQHIGEGGMGTVWMAEQKHPIRRRVALKLIKGAIIDKQVIARFEAERQALAMMNHPNIAKVLDAGTTEDGSPYFAMELVQGIPLNQYCDRNKLTPRERLQLFIPVCSAVQHAHQKGVIHRDLKPTNVLVCIYDGKPVPKVIDFGLAKALQHEIKLTEKTLFTKLGGAVGTLQYMSPEQATLDALDVDTRTDIYSLGAMLYELLAGSTPIEEDTLRKYAQLQILEFIRERDPPRPSDRLSSKTNEIQSISERRHIQPALLQQILRGDLDWIVMKAIEKDRTRRYASSSDLGDDIQLYLDGEAVKARPPSTSYKLQKFVRRNRGLVATAAAVLTLLIAGIVREASAFKAAYVKNAEVLFEKARADAEKEKAEYERLARAVAVEGKQKAEATFARSNYFLAMYRWKEGRVTDVFALLDKISHANRNIEWNLAYQRFSGSSMTLFGHGVAANATAFSPDGKLIVSGGADGSIIFWNAESGALIHSFKGHSSAIHSVAFSPDGTKIASSGGADFHGRNNDDFNVRIWNANTYELKHVLVGHSKTVNSVCFSPDGKTLASASGHLPGREVDSKATLWDATRKSRRVNKAGGVWDVETGKPLRVDNTVRLWDAESGTPLLTMDGHLVPVNCIAFSPDGKLIASGSHDGTLRLWDVSQGREVLKITASELPQTDRVESVVFTPDGTGILSLSDSESGVKLWDINSGNIIRTYFGFSADAIDLSPDGRTLALAKGSKIDLLDLDTGERIATRNGHASDIRCVRFSSDGRRFVTSSSDNTLKIWLNDHHSDEGIHVKHLQGGFEPEVVRFSPNGNYVASGGRDNEVTVWDTQTGQRLLMLQDHTSPVSAIAISPDSKLIASGGRANDFTQPSQGDFGVRIWEHKTGKLLRVLDGHEDSVFDLDFSPIKNRLATVSKNNLRIWDANSAEQIKNFSNLQAICAKFTSDGDSIVVGDSYGRVIVLDLVTGMLSKEYHGAINNITALRINRAGTLVAAASGQLPASIYVWNVESGELMQRLVGHKSLVRELAFTPDSTRLLSCGSQGDNKVRIWDVNNGEELAALDHVDGVESVDVSPDGTRIASCGMWSRDILLWELGVGETQIIGMEHSDIECASYSPNLDMIATCCDSEISLWDSHSRNRLSSFRDIGNFPTRKIGFSEDGKRVYVASETKHGIWNVVTGEGIAEEFDDKGVFSNILNEEAHKLVTGFGNILLQVDLDFKHQAVEKEFRKLIAKSDPIWHLERAAASSRSKDSYASMFHLGRAKELGYEGVDKRVVSDRLANVASDLLRNRDLAGAEPLLRQALNIRQEIAPYRWSTFNVQSMLGESIAQQGDRTEAKMNLEIGYVGLKNCAIPENSMTSLVNAVDRLINFAIDCKQTEEQVKWEIEKSKIEEVAWSEIPRTSFAAVEENDRIYDKVSIPTVQASQRLSWEELISMRNIVARFPSATYFNTLAVAEYRYGDFNKAITAALKSLELTPMELKGAEPSPIDLAILAMCYHKLGDMKQAKDYCERLSKAVKSYAFEDDSDVESFVGEVNDLFGEKVVP